MKVQGSIRGGVVALAAFTLAAGAQAANTVYPTTVAPVALTLAGYVQNFDSLTDGTTLPAGWQVFEGGGASGTGNATYGISNGGTTAGDVYSFGATNAADRALGSITSGSLTPARYGAFFTNATGAAITSLAVSYYGEQWRRGTATTDALAFSYLVGATDVNTGTWTNVSALSFASPMFGTSGGATDGNTNRTFVQGTITGLSIASGATFAIRWSDTDVTGTDDGLAIDDLAISAAGAVPETGTWALMTVGFGLLGGSLRRRKPVALAA